MLLTLILENFKKHAYLKVDFTAGTNGIYGSNYRGKTTLLNGILFALGGSSHVPGNRLHRIGADGPMKVSLTFALGSSEYQVVRTKSTANLFKDGAVIATSSSAVTNEIENLIGMTIKEWKELHYAKQKNAHSLLRYSANNLHQLMRRLNGADELDRVSANLKLMVTKAQAQVDAVEAAVGDAATRELQQEQLQKLLADLPELEEQVKSQEAGLAGAEAELAEASGKVVRFNEAMEKRRGWIEKAGSLLEKMGIRMDTTARAQTRYNAAEQAVKAIDAKDADQGRLNSLKTDLSELNRLEGELQAALKQQEQNAQHLAEAKAKVEARQKWLDDNKAALTTYREQLLADGHGGEPDMEMRANTLVEQRAALGVKIKQLEEAISGAVCSACNRPFDEHDPVALEVEKAQLVGQLQEMAEEAAALSDLRAELTRLVNSVSQRESELAQAQNYLEAETQRDAQRQEAVDIAKTTLAGMQSLAQKEHGTSDKEQLQALIVQLSGAAQRLRAANDALKEAGDELQEAKLAEAKATTDATEFGATAAAIQEAKALLVTDEALKVEVVQAHNSLRELVSERRELLAQGRTSLAVSKNQLTNLQETVNKVGEALKRGEAAAKRVASIAALQKYLKANSENYMAKVWELFMARASQTCSACTGGDISGLQRTDDGAFVFTEGDNEMQLEEASGAQEAIIGLAVQLALAEAAPSALGALLLDEPTADMDDDRSMATVATLGALGMQIVFVSHHQTDNAVCNNAIML